MVLIVFEQLPESSLLLNIRLLDFDYFIGHFIVRTFPFCLEDLYFLDHHSINILT